MHEESSSRRKVDDNVQEGTIPAYLFDRDDTTQAKVLSNTIKQKRKEKAGNWESKTMEEDGYKSYIYRTWFHKKASKVLAFHPPIWAIGVKKNPNGPMYTSLGVMTRGTIIEVSVSELGLVTPAGKVVWGK